jgi:probable addiction module antidote protein
MATQQKIKPYISHDEATADMLRKDPAFAAEYLNSVIEDGDQAELLVALRHVVDAGAGVQKVAEAAELNAKTLYRTLSPEGNPELRSLRAILAAIGLKITIEAVSSPRVR